MQHSAMIEILKSLKLHGMAHAIDELAAQGAPAYQAAQTILDSLLKAEVAEREVRSVNYQIKLARFPAYRDLSGFDFSQSVVNEALIRLLHRGQFMDEAHNVVLIGGPGTGKTHLAVERMLGHASGMIGLPLRLLARLLHWQQNIRTRRQLARLDSRLLGDIRAELAGGDMLAAIQTHAIHPVIDREFAFADAPAALEYMKSGSHFGKIVVRVGD